MLNFFFYLSINKINKSNSSYVFSFKEKKILATQLFKEISAVLIKTNEATLEYY
jgi:hypothetical protein